MAYATKQKREKEKLPPGGARLEEIRFELGFLEQKEFAKLFPLHPSDYCHILRYERLSIGRLVKIFERLIEIGYYARFEVVLADLDLFDDAYIYFPLQKKAIIVQLKKAYISLRQTMSTYFFQ